MELVGWRGWGLLFLAGVAAGSIVGGQLAGASSPPAGDPGKVSQLARSDIPGRHLALYRRHGGRCPGLSWSLLAGVGKVESDHGRVAGSKPGGSSSAGALGPMQFMPGTWPAYGHGDPHDPRNAIPAAARYLCANGLPDVRWALAAYNAGPGRAGNPPAVTRGYVEDVLVWNHRYRTGRLN